MLNEAQKNNALEIWENYKSSDKSFINANEEYTQEQIDNERNRLIPEIKITIDEFISDKIDITAFKSKIDSINKQNRLWGFKGINGQMYFNMLYNTSSGAGLLDRFIEILKKAIIIPSDISDAKSKISLLSSFSSSLAEYVTDKRGAPRTGSASFFISYFWQIQDPNKWPIYYNSMVKVTQDEGLWSPSGDNTKDYEDFYNLNIFLKNLFKWDSPKKEVTFWDIEHSFWKWNQKSEDLVETTIDIIQTTTKDEIIELPSSYIPPVVSIIPLLSKNDEKIIIACQNTGISVEKAFEQKISILFSMLGFKVEYLGQGYGRVPDGIAVSSEFHYAIIFDAKVRKDGYTIGTDDRAIREYIFQETERLKRQGIRNVYYAIISSSFNGDFDDVIRNLKMETDIREVLFIESTALLSMLEQKLRKSDLDLGPKGIQNIFAQSGIITNSDIKEYLDV